MHSSPREVPALRYHTVRVPATHGAPAVLTTTYDLLHHYGRTAGNRAVVQLLAGGPLTVQRDLFDRLRRIWDDVQLLSEVSRLLRAEPPDADPVVKVVEETSPERRRYLFENASIRSQVIARFEGDDCERLMKALLSGTRYKPGWESAAYHGMEWWEKAAITDEVDDQFARETGIDRKLDAKEPSDMPLVRRWLQLRDKVVGTREIRRKTYEDHIVDAIKILEVASFGMASDLSADVIYESDYWEVVEDEEIAQLEGREWQGKLVLKSGVRPSQGMSALMRDIEENAEHLSFDCAEYVQVAHLYARWKTLGDAGFDTDAGGHLELRIEMSTGVKPVVTYQRDLPTQLMTRRVDGVVHDDDTPIYLLLDAAPIGSRVQWRNLDLIGHPTAENENTVKIGEDSYSAHGLEGPDGDNDFTRAELEHTYAEMSERDPTPEYVRNTIFVRKIEHFSAP